MRSSARSHAGFSLVELLVASTLMLVVVATVFETLRPAMATFLVEPERGDMQQRLRVAALALGGDLRAAGAGPTLGARSGRLGDLLPPVMPYRQGRRNPDAPGTFRSDTLTMVRATGSAAQTSLASPLPARSGTAQVSLDPGCPVGDSSCGFRAGMTVLVFDDSGRHDLFSVTAVQGTSLSIVHNQRDTSHVYQPAVTRMVEAASRTYLLKTDLSANAFQLIKYEGDDGADVPVVDHVVDLSFAYLGDPEPPRMRRLPGEGAGPWTTYGPPPPPPGVQSSSYPPGENCVFIADAPALPAPRLVALGGSDLVRLDAAQLTDGPWCPDAADPNRYDADLLRIRSVEISVRVQSAVAAFRGPAGPLFTRAGLSSGGVRFLPDQTARFDITPRNLSPGR